MRPTVGDGALPQPGHPRRLVRSADRPAGGVLPPPGLPEFEWESDEVAFFALEGTCLGRYRRDLLAEEVPAGGTERPGGFRGITLAHTVDSNAAVDAVVAEAIEAGADLVREWIDREWDGYSGYVADPDGPHWEVAWNPHVEIG